jgi:hypothetical protein
MLSVNVPTPPPKAAAPKRKRLGPAATLDMSPCRCSSEVICERHAVQAAARRGREAPGLRRRQAVDSAFQRASGQAADKLPLQGEIDDDDRDKRDDQPGAQRGVIGSVLPDRLKHR